MIIWNIFHKTSIANKLLIWLLIIALFPLFIVSYSIFAISVKSYHREIENNLTSILNQKITQCEEHLYERRNILNELMHTPVANDVLCNIFKTVKQSGISSTQYKTLIQRLKSLLNYQVNRYHSDSLIVYCISAEGDLVFRQNCHYNIGINLLSVQSRQTELSLFFQQYLSLKKNNAEDSSAFILSPDGSVFTSKPLFEGNTFLGLIGIRTAVQEFSKILNKEPKAEETVRTVYLLKGDGKGGFAAALPKKEKLIPDQVVDLSSPRYLSLHKVIKTKPRGTDLSGEYFPAKVVYAWQFPLHLQWGLMVIMDQKKAYQPITTVTKSLAIIVLIATLVITITAIIISRLLCNPIVNFTRDTKLIALGNRSATAEIRTGNELRELAQAFNNMLKERSRTEAALHSSEERFTKILDSSPDSIIVTDLRGRILDCNKASKDIYGVPHKNDLIGMSGLRLVAQDDRKIVMRTYRNTIQNGNLQNKEFYCLRQNGSKFPVEVSASTLLDKNNQPQSLILIARDITKRKKDEVEREKVERELSRSNQELEQFAYVASHDLKAPLRAIHQISTWIEEDLKDKFNQETRKLMSLLQGRIGRMENLLNSLLEYSRVGRIKVTTEKVNTRKLILEIKEFISPDNSFTIELASDLPTFITHKVPLEQVFRNLISNAFKYHDRENGYVTISSREVDKFYEFTITDDGPGIPQQFQGKIFEMFKRLKSKDEIEGSGMGLALVKKIILNYGGTISLESEVGKGSTFTFTWPMDKENHG